MSKKSTRRTFMKSAAASGSSAAFQGCSTEIEQTDIQKRYPDNLTEPLPKGLEYILKVRNMAQRAMEEDAEKLNRAAELCSGAVVSGNAVYYTIRGHNEPQCILETMPGRPSFLTPLHPWDKSVLNEGDVLITVRTNQCIEAKEKDLQVIGILMPFQPQKTQGLGIVHRDYDKPYMEDIADVCIWDRTPYTVGILDFDLLPWKSIAAHGALDGILLGQIAAGTIDKLLAKGIAVEPT
jgi:hypothetical protein